MGRCGWGSQHSPPRVPVKHLVQGQVSAEGKATSLLGFPAFYGLFRFPRVSSCWFCSVLVSSPGILFSWTLLGCHGSDGQGEAAACAQFGKQSGFFSLKTTAKHNFCNLSLVPPFGQGQLLLVHLSLHHPVVPGIALELPISPCTSGEALLHHPVSPGWHVWFHPWHFSSEALVLAGLRRPHLLELESPCPEHPRQGQCQVIPRICGCPLPG